MNNKPLIGITTAVKQFSAYGIDMLAAYERNVRAIERVGGVPVLIPATLGEEALRAIYDRLDGVLLPGGSDMDSKYWGEDLHPKANGIDPPRDRTEVQLTRWAVKEDRPIFGICRGHQVMNVALGGSLYQDIASMVDTPLEHANFNPAPRDLRAHGVEIDPNSRLASILGQTDGLQVNSLHHQSLRDLAPDLVVTAKSPDGIIEGAEVPGRRFALSVQWHPEDLTAEETHLSLFRAFVDAARKGA